MQYLLELQRDWARSETYEMTTGVPKTFGGGYGLGITYAKTMFNASENHRGRRSRSGTPEKGAKL